MVKEKPKKNDLSYSFMQSILWAEAPDFTHNSWVNYDGDFSKLSRLSRNMLVSNLLVMPQDDDVNENYSIRLDILERFVYSPIRFLLLAGICANPNSKQIGRTVNQQLRMDEEFAMKLGLTFSMKERFKYSDEDNWTAIQIGLLLFYQSIGMQNRLIWDLCKLSLDKNLVKSINTSTVNDAGVHVVALKSIWFQIDNYLSANRHVYLDKPQSI